MKLLLRSRVGRLTDGTPFSKVKALFVSIALLSLLFACRPESSSEFDMVRKEAFEGDANAQHRLGMLYYYGHGAKQDYESALRWYTASAEGGIAGAQYDLAEMYRLGFGVEADLLAAEFWYAKAVEQGHFGAKIFVDYLQSDSEGDGST